MWSQQRDFLIVRSIRNFSNWYHLVLAPPDKILGLTEAFKTDSNPNKVNLGVGAYRDNDGKPVVLGSVKEAEKRIFGKNLDKEYASISGVPSFVKLSTEFAYGIESSAIKDERIAAVQSISGTGGCRIAFEFIAKFFGKGTKMYIPNPTWGNHLAIIKDSGLQPQYYRYYDKKTNSVNFEEFVEDIQTAENGSFFMLHACAHNPTGCDPTSQQWNELSTIMKEKQHKIFFDCAYQGFASGNAEADAYSIRKFVADGHQIMLSQSFAKNFGLYGERVGLFSIVTVNKSEAERVNSQLKLIVRAMYSNPPIHGARIVSEILSDPTLRTMWTSECNMMADRILSMRTALRTELESKNSRSWKHITDQIGMFCYTGLTEEQVMTLRNDYHIYSTEDGRFSMAGINDRNIKYLASSVANVLNHK